MLVKIPLASGCYDVAQKVHFEALPPNGLANLALLRNDQSGKRNATPPRCSPGSKKEEIAIRYSLPSAGHEFSSTTHRYRAPFQGQNSKRCTGGRIFSALCLYVISACSCNIKEPMSTSTSNIAKVLKFSSLANNGEDIQNVLLRARAAAIGNNSPTVVMTWTDLLNDESEEDSAPYPLLLIELPGRTLAAATEFLRAEPGSENVTGLNWTPNVFCFTLATETATIALKAGDVFPYLRLSNLGILLIAFVCDEQLTLVNYPYGRREFLNLCKGLAEEVNYTTDTSFAAWKKKQCQVHSVEHVLWQPLVMVHDEYDRY